ncbi:biotin transporter BioY [Cupriavidus necator]|uniref:molybdopterin guanine dinucleotide-containing S/N-oxide reductase n=1 Tax=Cupriavidus necator TaxID=106590 RepID=UPI0007351E88|nr:molybdopterin guanine dinucleotide-containing S/N-oxide reductase [Cupriavidus necator]KUE88832.1 biotin transporter BioY [Cupriavidus necator]
MRTYTAAHWGVYEVERNGNEATRLHPIEADPQPSGIGSGMLEACRDVQVRVKRPAVRKSWLENGPGSQPERRGQEPFVEIGWEEALALVSGELKRVIGTWGNEAIFGGSYGWSSAGRFHHAQSQIHRFLNAIGGYVRHADSYSLGAARVLMPHIVAPMDELMAVHTSWDVLARHTGMFVTFGGVPAKNAQVSAGGPGQHEVPDALRRMAAAGTRFVNISPVRDDLETGADFEWLAIRPNTDTALMLGLAHTLLVEGLHDVAFLDRYCVGFDRFAAYLRGEQDGQAKDAHWAAGITGLPAARIGTLAREMASARTMLNIAWSLQRSDHGEQPFWMLVTLAAMLGQIGLPGGGFGVGYGAVNMIGNANPRFSGPTLAQGENGVKAFIPVARIADMLEKPGETFTYNGRTLTYPDIRLVYWAGGNPFHHHQDLNRLLRAWQKPETVIVHEPFWTATAKLADIVLPATTTLERDDIGYSTRERFMVAMHQAMRPVGEARDDYDIFTELARRFGAEARYTEGLDTPGWLRRLYGESIGRAAQADVRLPEFDAFWEAGLVDMALPGQSVVMLEGFRRDPQANPLRTPSGRIEIFSQTIADFGLPDCPGHPQWFAPVEWLGADLAARWPLHMLSDQPASRLHSQLDHSPHSRATKVAGREPVMIHPTDAAARGIGAGDVVRVSNARGTCLAGAVISAAIRPGVIKLSTGAWFDPDLAAASVGGNGIEKHGNPNALTLDRPASGLSQGCIAQTCLVEVARFEGEPPPVTAFKPPQLQPRYGV